MEHLYTYLQVRFMLETMLALKNNDMRKIPGYDPEPVEKLRKLQRSLVGYSFLESELHYCPQISENKPCFSSFSKNQFNSSI